MIADLKPYPAYKESGVPWLGEVPGHWKVRKLRNVLKGVTERNRPDLPLLRQIEFHRLAGAPVDRIDGRGAPCGCQPNGATTRIIPTTVFDSIIVVTDRRILDQQIRDTIRQFAHVGAIVGHAERSGDLRC